MRLASFSFAAAVLTLAAPNAFPQIQCDTQTCTFTLNFDSVGGGSVNSFRFVTGAPYSGQESYDSKRTLQDGTHTSTKSSGPMIYRDSKGRMRMEHPAYGNGTWPDDRPKPPDDFTVVEIHDPVAGFEYILDPVTHVAHRMAFKPGAPREFTSAMLPGASDSFTARNGDTRTSETLGPKAVFGVAAVGVRDTNTVPAGASGEQPVTVNTMETWFDPKTGVTLLRKNGSSLADGMTMTMLNYSNAEPDAALFQIPEGYKVVDETGPFKVVHARTSASPAFSASGPMNPRSTVDCDEKSCTLTFDLTSQRPMAAISGAPYSGRRVIERTARINPNGRTIAAMTRTQGTTDRDSAGRVRTGKLPVGGGRGGNAQTPNDFGLVEIDDPVAGYQYILDTVDQVAYRAPYHTRQIPFQPRPGFQPAGTHTMLNGTVDVEEDLGEKTIYGVTAVGHRSTQTSVVRPK